MKETKFKDTEIGRIPEDWEVISLGDVGEVRMCKRIMKYQTSPEEVIPFYKIGTFGKQTDTFIPLELYTEFKANYNYPKKGDILLSAAGTIGRTVVFDGMPSYFQDSNIVWIENNERLLSNALLYYIYKNLSWVTESGTIPRIYNSIVTSIKFSIPLNKDEQHRITSVLTSIDNLISSLNKLIEKKRAIKQGAMQQLLTGKKRLKGFNEPWVEKTLKEICSFQNGYTPSKAINGFWENGTIPWFRMEDIRTDGRILADSIQHITEEAVKSSLFPAGSIIMSTTTTIGEHALLIVDSLENQRFTNLTIRKSLTQSVDTMWFYHYCFILGEWCRKNINEGGLAAVNMENFSNVIIPLPSFDEQKAIAIILSSMDKEISAFEAKREKYNAIKQGMMQQLLTGKIRLI